MPIVADALAELAKAPPKAFVRTRDALARRLRETGHEEAAAEIKARRVPTLPVWAVNRLAIEEPELIESLVAAADRVKAAQLGEKGRPDSLATATAAHRAAVDRLLGRASEMLREAGAASTHQLQDRIQTTLAAAASDPSARASLRKGQLDRELAARGFDVFEGATVRPVEKASRRSAPAPPRRKDSSEAAVASARAQASAERQRDAERERLRARLGEARAAVADAEAKAATAQEQAASAGQQVTDLLAQVNHARSALRDRLTEARRAVGTVKRARQALRSAERRAR